MICYRDRVFCVAPVHRPECRRALTDEVRQAAREWWAASGGDPADAPIAFTDFCTDRLAAAEEDDV